MKVGLRVLFHGLPPNRSACGYTVAADEMEESFSATDTLLIVKFDLCAVLYNA